MGGLSSYVNRYFDKFDVLDAWASVLGCDSGNVIACEYGEKAFLKGTVWEGYVGHEPTDAEPRTIEQYFNELLDGKDNLEVEFETIELKELKDGLRQFKGDYTFYWSDYDGNVGSLPASYIFIVDDKDRIVRHRSVPRDVAVPDNEDVYKLSDLSLV